jgi:hypothetical protein
MSEFIALPAIVVICYLIGFACKTIGGGRINKIIPVICGTVGGVLGVVVFFTIPGYIMAENWVVAVAVGIVSGFAATGINQIYKQITKA